MKHVMIRLPENNSKTPRTNRFSAYDIESLLASTNTSQTTATTNSSKLTAKVQPFEVRENDLMESSNPRSENAFPKGPRNPAFYPGLGYPPFGSPLSLANLHLYQLWSAQAGLNGFVNWPLFHHANPVFPQSTSRTQGESSLSDSNATSTSRTQTSVKHQSNHSNEDTSVNSNSATESLLAASECHLAVLQDDDGDTPLHIAIVHENQPLIKKLIGLISFSKLTVNTPNRLSQTALHLAVLTKQPNVIEQLMGADADANVQDRNGQTAIHLCAANGDLGCLTQIMNKNPKNLNLEIKNFNGLTALHLAVQKKHLDIVDALIQYGANTNAKDGKSGHTPLHHAIDQECCEVLQLLVAKGANINKQNYSGITPVQSANCCRNEQISKIILSQETVPSTAPVRPSAIQPTAAARSKTTNLPTTSTLISADKESGNKPEAFKRRFDSSPSTAKRARTDVTK